MTKDILSRTLAGTVAFFIGRKQMEYPKSQCPKTQFKERKSDWGLWYEGFQSVVTSRALFLACGKQIIRRKTRRLSSPVI